MHVIPSSAQAAYDQASSPCKLAAPRIAASLDELPLSVLCDPNRGTLEAVEFCGVHAAGTSFAELEVSSSRISNCQFLSCDFTGALFIDIAFEGCDFSNSIFDSAAFTRCTFNDCKFAGVSLPKRFGNRWPQRVARLPTAHSTDVFGKAFGLTPAISRQRT